VSTDPTPGNPADWEALRGARLILDLLNTAAREVRDERDAAATRLRLAGATMRSIAATAGVTESYLSRKAQGRGAPPLLHRRTTSELTRRMARQVRYNGTEGH
jgi:hypothetical protein